MVRHWASIAWSCLLQLASCRRLLLRCLSQQGPALGQPGGEAAVQLPVAEERQQGGRESEGEPRPLLRIGGRRLQYGQQGEVALLQRLEVPVLLQRAGLARAHVGEVGMQDQGQIASGHGAPSLCALYVPPLV